MRTAIGTRQTTARGREREHGGLERDTSGPISYRKGRLRVLHKADTFQSENKPGLDKDVILASGGCKARADTITGRGVDVAVQPNNV